MAELWTRHKTDPVNLQSVSVTLTLEVGVWELRTTHRLIMMNIYAKLF